MEDSFSQTKGRSPIPAILGMSEINNLAITGFPCVSKLIVRLPWRSYAGRNNEHELIFDKLINIALYVGGGEVNIIW